MKTIAAAMILAAALVVPATAHADCGDPGQDPCTGPVPTVDQVLAIMAELTDPNIPAANKGDIVTPPFTDEQAGKFDTMLNDMNSDGMIPRHVLPLNLTVTDIQPAPNSLAGATVTNAPVWRQLKSGSGPVVLAYQNGHWMITEHTAYARVYQFLVDCMKAGGPHGI
ncbi:hypothetical protein [Mycobacterium sp.]|jgi:hypothetical protein|uniref:hypothetical protein n=1 Tax=Mycobacterium sp. TaxID=1785 RepID=UPI003BB013B9